MNRLLLWIFFLPINLTNIYGQNPIKQEKEQSIVRKSTSHYYINDSTMVADSMFITLTSYDKNGGRKKEEETHYLKGKTQRYYTTSYKTDDQLLQMRENGRLTMKNEFDHYGTVIKSMTLINNGRDTLHVVYIPKYENGVLIQRKVIQKNPLGTSENTEHYIHQSFPDSTIVTSTVQDGHISLTEIKCYKNEKKLLYSKNILKAPGVREQSNSVVNKYDDQQNIIEITELVNDQVVASEKFYYQHGQLISAVLRKGEILIRTTHEFLKP